MGRPPGCSCHCSICAPIFNMNSDHDSGNQDNYGLESDDSLRWEDGADQSFDTPSFSVSHSWGAGSPTLTETTLVENSVTTTEVVIEWTASEVYTHTTFTGDIYSSGLYLLIDPGVLPASASGKRDGWIREHSAILDYRATFETESEALAAGMSGWVAPNLGTMEMYRAWGRTTGISIIQSDIFQSPCWKTIGKAWSHSPTGLCRSITLPTTDPYSLNTTVDLRHSSSADYYPVVLFKLMGPVFSGDPTDPAHPQHSLSGLSQKLSFRFGDFSTRSAKARCKGLDLETAYWLDGHSIKVDASAGTSNSAYSITATEQTGFTFNQTSFRQITIDMDPCFSVDGERFWAGSVADPDNAGEEYTYINFYRKNVTFKLNGSTCTRDQAFPWMASRSGDYSTAGVLCPASGFLIQSSGSQSNVIQNDTFANGGSGSVTFTDPYDNAPTFLTGNNWKYDMFSTVINNGSSLDIYEL